jgi:ABC-type transport system substrate-binding protein
VVGGWNWAWYCNETVEKQAVKADSMSEAGRENERIELWRKTFIQIMDDAPWVPIFNEQRFTMHTDRISGDPSLFVDPVHIPVNYENVYATDAQ